MIQLFLILSFFSKSAYQFFYFIASVAILPPYVLSGAYALKLALSGEGYGASDRSRNQDILIGALATLYGLWLVYAAGLNYLLMCAVLFAPGILVYMQARRERGEPRLCRLRIGARNSHRIARRPGRLSHVDREDQPTLRRPKPRSKEH